MRRAICKPWRCLYSICILKLIPRFSACLLLGLATTLPFGAMGQSNNLGSIGNTPLSELGLGELMPDGSTREQAMGEAGAAAPSREHISLLNPANLWYNRQVNLEVGLRTSIRHGRSGAGSVTAARFTPMHFTMTLPIAEPVTLALGLRQFSAIDYTVSAARPLAADTNVSFRNSFGGRGAISQAMVAASVRLAEGLTLGAQGLYWFGTQQRYSEVELNTLGLARSTSSRVSDVSARVGATYRLQLPGGKRIGLGLVADLPRQLRTQDEIVLDRYSINALSGTRTFLSSDTLLRMQNGLLQAPRSLRAGLSFEQPQRYTVAVDLVRELWAGVVPLGTPGNLQDAWRGSAGVEWVPNVNGQGYRNYISYRAGLYGRQLPFSVNGTRMQDIGLTLGLGWPVIRKEARYTRPVVNTNLNLGLRQGPTEAGSFREAYVNFTLGIVLNDSQWFTRFKID